MKKRNIMLGSAVLLAVLLVVGGTMAWFTAEAEVENKFKAGTVVIEINDKTLNDNEELVDFPEGGFENVNPGDRYDKIVNVKNIGSKRAYIRVMLTPIFDGQQDTNVVTYPILANWILHTDGWYYYKDIVAPQTGVTTNIIEEVLFAGATMGNGYQGAKFTLKVNAEAIQATNGAINDQWLVDPVALGLEVLP